MSRKNHIDIDKAIELLQEGYGLEVEVMQDYYVRIRSQESEFFWDWYHTTGSLCANKVTCRKVGEMSEPEAVARYIIRQIEIENGNI